MRDKQGFSYAILNRLTVGDTVTVDGDFTCIPAWAQRKVCSCKAGLYIRCTEGKHFLDGQIVNRLGYLIGIYPGKPFKVTDGGLSKALHLLNCHADYAGTPSPHPVDWRPIARVGTITQHATAARILTQKGMIK